MKPSATENTQILDSFQREEFITLSRWLMIWAGTIIFWMWSITDFYNWGFDLKWIIPRLLYLPFALFSYNISKTKFFVKNYQIPILLCVFYIDIVCCVFISSTGYEKSTYTPGMPQLALTLSVLPFKTLIFIPTWLLINTLPLILCFLFSPNKDIISSSEIMNYLTYSSLSIIIFLFVNNIRNRSYNDRLSLILQKKNQDKVIYEQSEEISKTKISSAIARTTQGLAHDIRRPFSMLKMAFDAFESASTPTEAQANVREVLPEVSRAMASVEGMLQDIMQIGGDSKPNQEEAVVEVIVGSVTGDVFRIFPEGDFEVTYDLKHKSTLFIDTIRVIRVFTNILVNAVQAMNGKGRIWIRSEDKGDFVEFRLGNVGSLIPKESLGKLFEAFFTEGKKGGTGLGLAIAQKVVTEHGGEIHCESAKSHVYPKGYVEFIFTLPKGNALPSVASEPLFQSSEEFRVHSAKLRQALREAGTPMEAGVETEIERKVKDKLATFEGPVPPLLIVDDEAAYRNMLQNLFQKDDSLISKIPLLFAKNSREALALTKEHKPFLVIEDVDLGPDSENGLDVIKNLRGQSFSGRICVHSNRFLFDDQKTALTAGADSVLPKPMSRGHLLQVILSSLPSKTDKSISRKVEKKRLRLVYLDDTKTFTMMWKMKLRDDLDLETFSNTASFLALCDADESFLEGFDAIVTDYHFANSDEHSGKTLALELRKRGYTGPIMLATNGDFEAEELKPHLTGAIGKEVPSLQTIRSWL